MTYLFKVFTFFFGLILASHTTLGAEWGYPGGGDDPYDFSSFRNTLPGDFTGSLPPDWSYTEPEPMKIKCEGVEYFSIKRSLIWSGEAKVWWTYGNNRGVIRFEDSNEEVRLIKIFGLDFYNEGPGAVFMRNNLQSYLEGVSYNITFLAVGSYIDGDGDEIWPAFVWLGDLKNDAWLDYTDWDECLNYRLIADAKKIWFDFKSLDNEYDKRMDDHDMVKAASITAAFRAYKQQFSNTH